MSRLVTFLKEWTLPVAMAFGAALYLVFAYVPALEPAANFFGPIVDTIFPTWIFFVLFTTFCRVDFHKVRLVPWHWLVQGVNTILVVAMVAVIIGLRLEGRTLVLTECLLMCVIAPCASAAPVVTSRLHGNLEEMTTFVCFSNVVAAAAIPLAFPMIDKSVDMPFWASFGVILLRVSVVLLVPMILAYIVKHLTPRFHHWIVSHPNMPFYMWSCGLVIISGTTVRNICHSGETAAYIGVIAIVSLAVCLAQFAAGRFMGRFAGTRIETGQGLGQKNTAFAIWVATAYLNPLSSVGPGCYILWQNLINSLEIRAVQRREQRGETFNHDKA